MTIKERISAEGETSREPKVRLNVNMTDESYNALRAAAADYGLGISEFVRNALRVYNTLLEEHANGKKVYIGTRDKVEKELIIP